MPAYPVHFLLQSNRMVILTLPDVPEVVVVVDYENVSHAVEA